MQVHDNSNEEQIESNTISITPNDAYEGYVVIPSNKIYSDKDNKKIKREEAFFYEFCQPPTTSEGDQSRHHNL